MFAEANRGPDNFMFDFNPQVLQQLVPPSLILETVITLAIYSLPLLILITTGEEETDVKGSVRENISASVSEI